jgi:hypothetical protein
MMSRIRSPSEGIDAEKCKKDYSEEKVRSLRQTTIWVTFTGDPSALVDEFNGIVFYHWSTYVATASALSMASGIPFFLYSRLPPPL